MILYRFSSKTLINLASILSVQSVGVGTLRVIVNSGITHTILLDGPMGGEAEIIEILKHDRGLLQINSELAVRWKSLASVRVLSHSHGQSHKECIGLQFRNGADITYVPVYECASELTRVQNLISSLGR